MTQSSCEGWLSMTKEDVSAYILITCGNSSLDGKIHVEMTYEGDPSLVSYLLKTAKESMDQSIEESFEQETL